MVSITRKAPAFNKQINYLRIVQHVGWSAASPDRSSAFGQAAQTLGVQMKVAVLQRRMNLR